MEKMPLIYLILYSVPESVILISLSSALYGYNVKENFKRIFLLSVLLAMTTYVVRMLPIAFGVNALIELPVFILLTWYCLKISIKEALFVILTGFICIALSETLVDTIATGLIGMKLNDIFANLFQRFIYSWAVLAVLLVPTVVVIRKKISFMSAARFLNSTPVSKKVSILIVIVLIQAFLAGVLLLTYIYGDKAVWPSAFDVSTLMKIISFALIAIPVISIIILKRIFLLSQQEAIIATQEAFIDNVHNLFVTVRGQRHDFLNHVQVFYSLIKSGRQEEGCKYIEHIIGEIREVNDVIKVQDPCLSALLNTKLALAERYNIQFITNIETTIEKTSIKSLDLVKILGNLIDNAIDAVIDQPQEFKIVRISLRKVCNKNVFEVFNPRPVITPQQIEKIFKAGYSTKANSGHSGLGLSIVQEIAKKYKGEIVIKSDEENGTTFTVVIPK